MVFWLHLATLLGDHGELSQLHITDGFPKAGPLDDLEDLGEGQVGDATEFQP